VDEDGRRVDRPAHGATLAHYALLRFAPAARRKVIAPPLMDCSTSRDDEFDRALGSGIDIMRAPF